MITDFPVTPLSNMSGMQSFSFSPAQNVFTWPPVLNNKTTWGILFKDGLDFFKGYSTIDMLEFHEDANEDDNGDIYTWQINGYYPGDSPETLNLMHSLKKCKQHVVLVKDNNGILRLVGYKAPLSFDYSFSPGKVAGADARGYNLIFTGQGDIPAPVYDPTAP